MKTIQILNGDSLEVLKQFPDNYFDAVVTDPPYGLGKEPNAEEMLQAWITSGYLEVKGSGFMGKEWDAFVPQPIFWKEVFRVLKHGGHIVAFFGTRTYDWGVMAMRLAGFEVRDCIQWIYGSGFPKSHNISKTIDKKGGQNLSWFIDYILEIATKKGISKKELTMLFPSKNGNATGWLWNKQNNQSITLEQYNKIKDYLQLPFENIEQAQREVVGKGKAGLTKGSIANFSGKTEFDITASSTEQAKQWEGWGSALKPANEPIVLARKPLEKGLSIAENVLKNGTGGINIDATRVGTIENLNGGAYSINKKSDGEWGSMHNFVGKEFEQPQGRFPANLILTHHPECECIGTKKVKAIKGGMGEKSMGAMGKNGIYGNYSLDKLGANAGGVGDENGEETIESWNCHEDCPIKIMDEQSGGDNDKGGASRFFYVAKASKKERNKGLEGFEEKIIEGRDEGQDERNVAFKPRPTPMANIHPTIKPVALMRYLVRMITPPNGIVLDPFNGSGTTGVACKVEGFNYVGIELDAEYCKISEARIQGWEEEIEMPETIQQKEVKKGSAEEIQPKNQLNLF